MAIYVFSMKEFRLHRVITGLTRSVISLSCFQTGQLKELLVVITSDDQLHIWDMNTGALVHRSSLTQSRLTAVECGSSEGNLVALGTSRGRGLFLNVQTKEISEYSGDFDCSVHVIRQNGRIPSNFLFGSEKGHIYYVNSKTSRGLKITQYASRLVAAEWDPLSENYFIAGWADGTIKLFDAETSSCMFHFDKTSPISAVHWIPSVPGGFVSTDANSGVVRCWNVSKKVPETVARIRNFGFRELSFLSKTNVLCSFSDGAVGIFDWNKRKFAFITQGGHTETVFDCEFSKVDRNIFATSSYDTSIKLWDVTTMECVDNLVGAKQIIFCISWHPNKNMLASSLKNGEIWIWDVSRATPVSKFKLHNDIVYRVAWNQQDPSMLVSSSKNRRCAVFRDDGKVLRVYKHPKPVFGVDWSPFDSNVFATGCIDGVVRVFDVASSSPIHVLRGHRDSVYNVKWSPLLPNTLISGSNDNTVIVWFLEKGEHKVLSGHTNNVRALEWSPEFPNLCFSGGWDGNIHMWDISSGKCLYRALDHCADVYGLSIHPHRPFFMVSSSRDTTLRFWQVDKHGATSALRTLCFLSKSADKNVMGTPDECLKSNKPLFCGKASKEIFSRLKDISLTEKFRLLHEFLSLPVGQSNIWDLVQAMKSNEFVEPLSNPLKFEKNLLSTAKSKAKELEATKGKRILGKTKIEAALKEAALLYLKMGDIRQYCDVMVQIGAWEKALSVAPAVSMEYWHELALQFAEKQLRMKKKSSIPYLLATNQPDTADRKSVV